MWIMITKHPIKNIRNVKKMRKGGFADKCIITVLYDGFVP